MPPKTKFRVTQLTDGTLLAEKPFVDEDDSTDWTLAIDNRGAVSVRGLLELSFGKYLIVATARSLAATVQAHKVWRITAGSALPVGDPAELEKQKQGDESVLAKYELDQELLTSVMSIVNSGHLYYSSTYDITHSLQYNYLLSTEQPTQTIIDDRYFFNKFLSVPFFDTPHNAGLPWVFKTLCGFAGEVHLDVPVPPEHIDHDATTRSYTVTLISRINRRRMGARYARRGLDTDGNAANNVEMEQIVFEDDLEENQTITSFVQHRGSAPGLWGQDLDLSYTPKLIIGDIHKANVWEAVRKHYEDYRWQYSPEKVVPSSMKTDGKVVCINLLDDRGFEGDLTKMYEASVHKFENSRINYEEFPINKWCKKMNFRNMDILVDRVRDRLVNSGWFVGEGLVPAYFSNGTFHVTRLQTGVQRVSCLDSLDRTNLTCSLFARYVLPYQIQHISPEKYPAADFIQVNGANPEDVRDPVAALRKVVSPSSRAMTSLWADSGDAISLLYAGTRALKADVTRTGQRQWVKGSVEDGLNSLTRYYLNNYVDGHRQDAYDIWTGKVNPDQIQKLAATDGLKKAQHIRHPFIAKGQGILGRLVPGFVVDNVEPLLQAVSDFTKTAISDAHNSTTEIARTLLFGSPKGHIDDKGTPRTPVGFFASAIKLYAPDRVANLFDVLSAVVVSLYVLLFVKVFSIQGKLLVGRPKLSREHETIRGLVEGVEHPVDVE
ncbi:Phosphatidylinositide phosphatase SAC1 [Rhizophlyctis rosea]|nr:Phosphatidylinositide phosphatase SAC1 [Rhizophlyctis rosea]